MKMKKRLGSFLLMMVLVCSLCSCIEEEDKTEQSQQVSSDVQSTEADSESTPEPSQSVGEENDIPNQTDKEEGQIPEQPTEPEDSSSEHRHVWGDWEVTTPATCTKDGVLKRTCATCSETETSTQRATGHNLVNNTCKVCGFSTACQHPSSTWKEVKKATCTAEGTKNKVCSSCAAVLSSEKTPALGHALTSHAAKAATCTQSGNNAYKTCSRCSYSTYQEIAAKGHALTSHAAKAATCTQSGNNAYKTCSRCSYSTYQEIAAKGHALTSHAAKAATCTQSGNNAYKTCSRCSYSTYQEIAAKGHTYVKGTCTACGAADSGYIEEIKVPATEKKTISVDPITQKTLTVPAASILIHQGNISQKGQRDTYTYTVPRDGRLRIDISEVYSGNAFELYVLDRLGKTVASDGYCVNGDGITLKDLKKGETYQIQIRQYSGFSSYVLTLGEQKETKDASQYTVVKDSIEYTGQSNVYTFKPSVDGSYRFEISGMKSGTGVELYVFNKLGETVKSDGYCVNGEGITINGLSAKETYEVQVRQYKSFSDYTLSIGMQKETVNVSAYTEVKDSVEFTDQKNVYTFKPSVDGSYRFEISGMKSGTGVELYVFNKLGETVKSDGHCVNGEGITINGLSAKETYEVQVRQYKGFSSYTLSIGKQKPTVNVSSLVKISDSIQYTGQRNLYNFVADAAGNHTFTISGMSSNRVELYILNELEETVASDTYCQNGDSITLKNLTVGTAYTIAVYQYYGTGSYTLTIK